MYILVKNSGPKPPVIVLQRLDAPVLCFQGNTVTRGSLDDFWKQLNDPDTW